MNRDDLMDIRDSLAQVLQKIDLALTVDPAPANEPPDRRPDPPAAAFEPPDRRPDPKP